MIYLDTSVLGAVFFREPGAAALVDRLESLSAEGLATSAWTLTEMASAAALKLRTGALDDDGRQRAMSAFQRFVSAHCALVEIEPVDFRAAALLLEAGAPLRAGDAMHLAVARRVSARIATLDRQQAAAAAQAKIEVVAVG